jgi:hypothetical protein
VLCPESAQTFSNVGNGIAPLNSPKLASALATGIDPLLWPIETVRVAVNLQERQPLVAGDAATLMFWIRMKTHYLPFRVLLRQKRAVGFADSAESVL